MLNLSDVHAWAEQNLLNAIPTTIIGAIILQVPTFSAMVSRRFLKLLKAEFQLKILLSNALIGVAAYFASRFLPEEILFPSLACLATAVNWKLYDGFRQLGISDAHAKTIDGINFKSSLKMANSSIDFLGIGADKLTRLDEFPEAMRRCGSRGNKVRFLLLRPENKALERAALRNNVNLSSYATKVTKSLARIAEQKRVSDLDIEVRFYDASSEKDLQMFRLMFIDKRVCLASWTVWGNHEGRDNPQVILRNNSGKSPDLTAYKAFYDHFEAIWDSAEAGKVELSKFE